jgi:hypothetical protein
VNGRVRLLHVQRMDIGIREDDHSPNPQTPASPNNPAGDLAAIGNQE